MGLGQYMHDIYLYDCRWPTPATEACTRTGYRTAAQHITLILHLRFTYIADYNYSYSCSYIFAN